MRYNVLDIPWLFGSSLGRHIIARAILLRLRIFLMPMAKLYRKFFLKNPCVIAVTGSFGKTTTTRAVMAALLQTQPPQHNRNPESFVAIDMLKTPTQSEYAVFEAGVDRPGRMAKFAQMLQPDIVVVTSIGSEHQTSFGTLENTQNEKSELVKALSPLGVAVLNADDPNVMWMKTQTQARIVTFGFSENADIQCRAVNATAPYQTDIHIRINGEDVECKSQLIGKIMVYPILAAIAVATAKDLDFFEIKPFLEALVPTHGRLQPVPLKCGATLLRDDYKALLETFTVALDTFETIISKRRIAVIGEIDELQEKEGPTYRWLGERVAHIADIIIFIGGRKRLKPIRSGIRKTGFPTNQMIYAAHSMGRIAETLIELMQPGDLVLLKGSGSQKLERIVRILEGRNVRCELKKCSIRHTACIDCPMLERGWADGKTYV